MTADKMTAHPPNDVPPPQGPEEEKRWAQALAEAQSSSPQAALWSWALVRSNGAREVAVAEYVRARVSQLRDAAGGCTRQSPLQLQQADPITPKPEPARWLYIGVPLTVLAAVIGYAVVLHTSPEEKSVATEVTASRPREIASAATSLWDSNVSWEWKFTKQYASQSWYPCANEVAESALGRCITGSDRPACDQSRAALTISQIEVHTKQVGTEYLLLASGLDYYGTPTRGVYACLLSHEGQMVTVTSRGL